MAAARGAPLRSARGFATRPALWPSYTTSRDTTPRRDHIDRLEVFSFYTKMKRQHIVERTLDEFFKQHGM